MYLVCFIINMKYYKNIENIEEQIIKIISKYKINTEEKKEFLKEISHLLFEYNQIKQKEACKLLIEIINELPDKISFNTEKYIIDEFFSYYNIDPKKIEEEINNGEEI